MEHAKQVIDDFGGTFEGVTASGGRLCITFTKEGEGIPSQRLTVTITGEAETEIS
jgi:hypothetical protein